MRTIPRRGLRAALGLCAFLLIAAYYLLPTQLGGNTVYVTTHGISMEPRFHTGDLAILRGSDTYRVGDVVAYRSHVLKTVVMHRIVKIDNGLYTFKGDNNSWLDPAPATRDELMGKLAIRAPHGGAILRKAADFAPFVLGMVVLLVGAGTTTTRRRHRKGSRHAARAESPHPKRPLSSELATTAAVTAAVGAFGVFLGVLAVRAPTPNAVQQNAAAAQRAKTVFSYSTHVGRTAAYDGTTVTSPDPVFRSVANTVDLTVEYTGSPGTLALDAVLSATSGWHSGLELAPPTPFTSSSVTKTVPLNLAALDARAKAAAEATGIAVTGVAIDVTATVTSGTTAPFVSVLHLSLTPLQLRLVGPTSGLVHDESPTTPASATSDSSTRTVALFGRRIPVRIAFVGAALMVIGSLVSGVVIGVRARKERRTSEGDTIRRRYADLLVPVEPISNAPGRPVVDVTEMATLVKLAERYGLLVLHWSRAGVQTFVVQDENTTYRYRVNDDPEAASASGAHRAEPKLADH